MSIELILLITVFAVIIYIFYLYNDLITTKLRVKEAWSQIDVQLIRRADLIPNIVETVKGYAKHEKNVLENITRARSALIGASSPATKAKANNQLFSALKSLFAVAEAYPKLAASENFLQLQRQLEDSEDKISYARQFYNTAVLDYNTKLQVFPSMVLANYLKFQPQEFFTATDEEVQKISVKFE